jgi:hypothetical protein
VTRGDGGGRFYIAREAIATCCNSSGPGRGPLDPLLGQNLPPLAKNVGPSWPRASLLLTVEKRSKTRKTRNKGLNMFGFLSAKKRAATVSRVSFRPSLEALEGRELPTVNMLPGGIVGQPMVAEQRALVSTQAPAVQQIFNADTMNAIETGPQVFVRNNVVIANQIQLDPGSIKLNVPNAIRPGVMPLAGQPQFKPGILIVNSPEEINTLPHSTEYQIMEFKAGQGFTIRTGQTPHWTDMPMQNGETRYYRRGPDGKWTSWSSVHSPLEEAKKAEKTNPPGSIWTTNARR